MLPEFKNLPMEPSGFPTDTENDFFANELLQKHITTSLRDQLRRSPDNDEFRQYLWGSLSLQSKKKKKKHLTTHHDPWVEDALGDAFIADPLLFTDEIERKKFRIFPGLIKAFRQGLQRHVGEHFRFFTREELEWGLKDGPETRERIVEAGMKVFRECIAHLLLPYAEKPSVLEQHLRTHNRNLLNWMHSHKEFYPYVAQMLMEGKCDPQERSVIETLRKPQKR